MSFILLFPLLFSLLYVVVSLVASLASHVLVLVIYFSDGGRCLLVVLACYNCRGSIAATQGWAADGPAWLKPRKMHCLTWSFCFSKLEIKSGENAESDTDLM